MSEISYLSYNTKLASPSQCFRLVTVRTPANVNPAFFKGGKASRKLRRRNVQYLERLGIPLNGYFTETFIDWKLRIWKIAIKRNNRSNIISLYLQNRRLSSHTFPDVSVSFIFIGLYYFLLAWILISRHSTPSHYLVCTELTRRTQKRFSESHTKRSWSHCFKWGFCFLFIYRTLNNMLIFRPPPLQVTEHLL